ncbi:MAG: hypothetical protein IPO66_11445 [Rhodanobacteraceae bacterium]|nr:hypothetical protein [Rhodanobacteraceae bacterium]
MRLVYCRLSPNIRALSGGGGGGGGGGTAWRGWQHQHQQPTPIPWHLVQPVRGCRAYNE